MSLMTDCCVFTRGQFFLSDWKCDGCDPLCSDQDFIYQNLGNVVSCTIDILSEIVGRENKFNPLEDTTPRTNVLGVDLSLSISCASVRNLRRALYSDDVPNDDGTFAQETFIRSLSQGDFIPFKKKGVALNTLVVKLKDAYGELQTLVVDTDFTADESGITIKRDDIAIASANAVRLNYDYNDDKYFVIDFMKKIIGYKSLYFKGLNYGEGSEDLFDAHFPKVIFAPLQNFDLLTTDDFFTINLTGKVEREKNNDWFKLIKKTG